MLTMLKNMKIRRQLTLLVVVISSLTVLLTVVYLLLLAQIRFQSDEAAALNQAALNANEAAIATQYMAYNTSSYSLGHFENREDFTTHLVRFDTALAALTRSRDVLTSDEQQNLDKVADTRAKYEQAANTLFNATNTLFRTASDTDRLAAKTQQDQTWKTQYFLGKKLDIIFSDLSLTLGSRATDASDTLTRMSQEANVVGIVLPLLVIGLNFLVMSSVRRAITKPLQTLTQVTSHFAIGDYAYRAAVESQNEFGDLSASFNQMADAVQQRDADVNELNKSLEQRVAERTEDYRKARDQALAATRLAQENTRLKSEFLSTMSHELRTPLNAIEGFAGVLLNKMGGTDYNAKTEGYLNRIRSNSKRLLQLINDFLDLSRIESGRLELANQPFSPVQLARRWQDEISVLAEKKGLQFEASLGATLPETIYGDEEAVSKIAINLLGNAIKFTEHGRVKLAVERNNGTWEIIVEDTGIGIPPHARDFIFDEFRQVDQSSKRKYGGTGLGLAIVQKYARAMGGSVNVTSELGTGSVFTVTLPCQVSGQLEAQGQVYHD